VIGTAENQDLDQLVEDEAVGTLGVVAEGMGIVVEGSRSATWAQMGSMSDAGRAGTGTLLHTESLKTFPEDELSIVRPAWAVP
jgi:hypothetical protein